MKREISSFFPAVGVIFIGILLGMVAVAVHHFTVVRPFEQSFGVKYPYTDAERQVVRPKIISVLVSMHGQLLDIDAKTNALQGKLDSLGDTHQDALSRFNLLTLIQDNRVGYFQFYRKYNDICVAAASAGFRDEVIHSGGYPDWDGGGSGDGPVF